ncbi:MAG: CdaR family protein [Nitrospiraceae bacterium]|nr:CdaR family protein [Nitrospiraceae bacterium]MDA8324683.1 CdaR family protein [Nitrospiraceae bacterium]
MREKIFSNIWLKGAALLMAVFLWFFVQFRGQTEMTVEVEPEFSKLPAALAVAEKRPNAIDVTLKGNELVLKRLKPGDIRIPLQLKDMETGRIFIPLAKSDVYTPPHISVVSVSPSGIWLYIEHKASVILPVEPDIKGRPAPGFTVYEVQTTPDRAEAEGPKETLSRLDSLKTEPIDISGASDSLDKDVDIKIPDDIDKVEPRQVGVKVVIRRKQ